MTKATRALYCASMATVLVAACQPAANDGVRPDDGIEGTSDTSFVRMADKTWSDLPQVELAIQGSMSGQLPVARELGAKELSETISAQTIGAIDVNCADCSFNETFSTSGAWRAILYGRGPITVEGEWRIEGNRVCVLAQSARLTVCRRMWRDAAGDLYLPTYRFFATDLSSDDAVNKASTIKSTDLFKVRAT